MSILSRQLLLLAASRVHLSPPTAAAANGKANAGHSEAAEGNGCRFGDDAEVAGVEERVGHEMGAVGAGGPEITACVG